MTNSNPFRRLLILTILVVSIGSFAIFYKMAGLGQPYAAKLLQDIDYYSISDSAFWGCESLDWESGLEDRVTFDDCYDIYVITWGLCEQNRIHSSPANEDQVSPETCEYLELSQYYNLRGL